MREIVIGAITKDVLGQVYHKTDQGKRHLTPHEIALIEAFLTYNLWLPLEEANPEHGKLYYTYTPQTDDTQERYQVMPYGAIAGGFPKGVTHIQACFPPTNP